MKRMMQFRYHGPGNSNNYPSGSLAERDWANNLFYNYGAVSHLGIQGEPGVVFYLNGGNDPITIGNTGIYEIDLEGVGRITSLRFDSKVLNETYNNSASINHRLIVDIVYDGPEVYV